ncbi:MAG: hypothetical protein WCE79_25770 [Xanthobacteraceae bacterium]
MIRVLILGLLSVLSVSTGVAQPSTLSPEEFRERIAGAAEKLLRDQLKPRIVRALPQEFAGIADSVDISIDKQNWGLRAHATKIGATRTIEFSLGYIMAIDIINRSVADAMCCVEVLGAEDLLARQRHFATYMRRLERIVQDAIVNNKAARNRYGEQFARLGPLCENAYGAGADYCYRLRLIPDHQTRYTNATYAAHTMTLGHEMAHHFLRTVFGDTHGKQSKLKSETDADQWGIDLTFKTNQNILHGVNGLWVLRLIEGGATGDPDHPATTCRIVVSVKRGLAQVYKDPEFHRYLRGQGKTLAEARRAIEADLAALLRTSSRC